MVPNHTVPDNRVIIIVIVIIIIVIITIITVIVTIIVILNNIWGRRWCNFCDSYYVFSYDLLKSFTSIRTARCPQCKFPPNVTVVSIALSHP